MSRPPSFPIHIASKPPSVIYRSFPSKGDYFLLEDVDVLPKTKPKPKPPPMPVVHPRESLDMIGPTVPITRRPKDTEENQRLTVWERQTLRNAQRENAAANIETELKPRKITIWEKHAARKAEKENLKEIKEKESNVVHSELPPPPRISTTPAFRAYKNNREALAKEAEKTKEETPSQGQLPMQKFDLDMSFNIRPYETIIGSIGGVVVGIDSGFFAGNRIPTPNVPLPPNSPLAGNFQAGVRHSAIVWRFVKRAAISGLMFSIIGKQLEQIRNKDDWKNSAISGFICGTTFGLRGGPRGVIVGALGFTGFATIGTLCRKLLESTK